MKVAVLYDPGNADGTKGGAELTMEEYAAAMPVERCDVDEAETVVIGNCVTFGADLIDALRGKRVVRVHHDLARHENPDLRRWLNANADHTFCSPLHQELYDFRYGVNRTWPNIPPAIDLAAFKPPRQSRRNREGAVAIGAWQNYGKGQQLLAEWADANGGLTVYGTGPLPPLAPSIKLEGPLEPSKVAQTLWGYETFVHLPTAPEPFGRGVAEAWAAGCHIVTNSLVGARYWIEEAPDKLATAAEDFWGYVCE